MVTSKKYGTSQVHRRRLALSITSTTGLKQVSLIDLRSLYNYSMAEFVGIPRYYLVGVNFVELIQLL